MLSDSDDSKEESQTPEKANFIEIEASVNFELKRWQRKIASKVLEQERFSSDGSDSSISSSDDQSSVPRLLNHKTEDYFSDKNSFLFFEASYKPLREQTFKFFSSAEIIVKTKKNKHLDKVLDTLLDDWHKFAQNRINDEGAKNPEKLQEFNVMSQQPTS